MNTTVNEDRLVGVSRDIFIIVSIVFIPMTIFGNSLILYCVWKYQSLRRRIYGLIANLAISDLCVGLVVYPYQLLDVVDPLFSRDKYHCLTREFLNTFFLAASVTNLFIISLDRYRSVVNPLNYYSKSSNKYVKRLCIVGWTVAFIFGILPLIGWNQWSLDKPCGTPVLHTGYISLVLTVYVTLIITTFTLYILVVKRMYKLFSGKTSYKGEDISSARSRGYTKHILKTKIMMIVFGVFAMCWGPYCVVVIVQAFFLDNGYRLQNYVKYLGCLGEFNCSLNWIIYGAKNETMRLAFKQALCCRKLHNNNSLNMTESACSPPSDIYCVQSQSH